MANRTLQLHVEFALPEETTSLAEALIRLGIRLKQLGNEGEHANISQLQIFKHDLAIEYMHIYERNYPITEGTSCD